MQKILNYPPMATLRHDLANSAAQKKSRYPLSGCGFCFTYPASIRTMLNDKPKIMEM
jgi:hypothetical protein